MSTVRRSVPSIRGLGERTLADFHAEAGATRRDIAERVRRPGFTPNRDHWDRPSRAQEFWRSSVSDDRLTLAVSMAERGGRSFQRWSI